MKRKYNLQLHQEWNQSAIKIQKITRGRKFRQFRSWDSGKTPNLRQRWVLRRVMHQRGLIQMSIINYLNYCDQLSLFVASGGRTDLTSKYRLWTNAVQAEGIAALENPTKNQCHFVWECLVFRKRMLPSCWSKGETLYHKVYRRRLSQGRITRKERMRRRWWTMSRFKQHLPRRHAATTQFDSIPTLAHFKKCLREGMKLTESHPTVGLHTPADTLLGAAVKQRRCRLLKYLILELGFDPNSLMPFQDFYVKNGRNMHRMIRIAPIHYACYYGIFPMVQFLVEEGGVDVNQKTESIFVRRPKGCSPSDIILYGNASPRKKIQMLEILKTKGGEFTGKKHEQIAVHIFDPDI